MGVVGTGQITLYDHNDTPTPLLSLDRCALPADASGVVTSFSAAITTLSIFRGGVDESSLWAVSVVKSSGLGGTLAGKTFTVSSLSVDSGYVDFTATRAGFANLTKRFEVAKVKQGVSANNYNLSVDAGALKRNSVGQFTPATVSISATLSTGATNPTAYAGRFIISEFDGTSWIDTYTSSGNESSKAFSPTAGISALRVRLYLAGGTTTLLQERIIPVVADGTPIDVADNAPKYYSIFIDSEPQGTFSLKDFYLRASITAGNRGLFAWSGSVWEKTVDQGLVGIAVSDIAAITMIFADGQDGRPGVIARPANAAVALNAFIQVGSDFYKCTLAGVTATSAPAWTTSGAEIVDGTAKWVYVGEKPYLYGKASDYGASEDKVKIFSTVYAHSMRGGNAFFEGEVSMLKGTVRGVIETPVLSTTYPTNGSTIDVPSPRYWNGTDLINFFAQLSDGLTAADASTVFGGKTVAGVLKGNAPNSIYYFREVSLGGTTFTGTSWQNAYSVAPNVEGRVKVYISGRNDFNLFSHGRLFVRILINGSEVASGWTEYDVYPGAEIPLDTQYLDLHYGDTITLQVHTDNWSIPARLEEFAIGPFTGSIGVKATDNSFRVIESATMYNPSWNALEGAINVTGLSEFNTQAYDNYWQGWQLQSALSPYILGAVNQLVDEAVSTFNGKAVRYVYIVSGNYIDLTHTDGSVFRVWYNNNYTYSGSIKLLNDPGNIKMFSDFEWDSEIIGSDKYLRIMKAGSEIFRIAPDGTIRLKGNSVIGWGIESTGSNSNGNWVRFSDGLQIVWNSTTRTDVAINTQYGTSGIYIGGFTVSFPQSFSSSYPLSVTTSLAQWDTGGSWSGTSFHAGTTSFNLRIYDSYSRNSGSPFYLSWMAIGRWK